MSKLAITFVPPIHQGKGPHWAGHFDVRRGSEQAEHVEICLSNRLGEELCPALGAPSLEDVIKTKGEEMIRSRIAAGEELPERLDIGRDVGDSP